MKLSILMTLTLRLEHVVVTDLRQMKNQAISSVLVSKANYKKKSCRIPYILYESANYSSAHFFINVLNVRVVEWKQ